MGNPLLDKIRAFEKEIEAISLEIKKSSANSIKPNTDLQDRIGQLWETWKIGLQQSISTLGVSQQLIKDSGICLTKLLQISRKRILKKTILNQLKDVFTLSNRVYFDATEIISHPPYNFSLKTHPSHTPIEVIPDLPTNLVPKALFGYINEMEEFLEKYPFDNNVFIMIRYAKQSKNLLKKIESKINEVTIGEIKLFPVIAINHKITDDLYNPIACLLCCKYGIAVFDSIPTWQKFNPNVAYELGIIHFLKRECLILKDSKLKTLPSDILHKIYTSFSSPDDAARKVESWIRGIILDNQEKK